MTFLLQIYNYIRSHKDGEPIVFYYASTCDQQNRCPDGVKMIKEEEILTILSGPAVLYKKDIVVCTYSYNDLPCEDSVIVVRLTNKTFHS